MTDIKNNTYTLQLNASSLNAGVEQYGLVLTILFITDESHYRYCVHLKIYFNGKL